MHGEITLINLNADIYLELFIKHYLHLINTFYIVTKSDLNRSFHHFSSKVRKLCWFFINKIDILKNAQLLQSRACAKSRTTFTQI